MAHNSPPNCTAWRANKKLVTGILQLILHSTVEVNDTKHEFHFVWVVTLRQAVPDVSKAL